MERENKSSKDIDVVVFIIKKGNKILLEKRTEKEKSFFGYTIIPGGGIIEGETLNRALLRELEEELGITPESWKIIGKVTTTSKREIKRYVFVVNKFSGEIKNIEGRNLHVYADLDEALAICQHPISQEILKIYKRSLVTSQA